MIVDTIQGDLLSLFRQGWFCGIAHGANCQTTMGAGIAKQIALEFPEARMADNDFAMIWNDREMWGEFSVATVLTQYQVGDIFNLYTQLFPGKVDQYHLEKAIALCFTNLNNYVKSFKKEEGTYILGIPLIGCGIAQGDWGRISQIINEVTPDIDIIVVEYSG